MLKHSCSLLAKLPKQQVAQWLAGIETVIFGTDGVLWQEYKPIEGSLETFNAMKAKGRRSLIVTNDSNLMTSDLIKKAQSLGFQVGEADVLSSTGSISSYLTDRKFNKKVLVLGGEGICRELKKAGFCTMIDQQKQEKSKADFVRSMELDPHVGAVLVARNDGLHMNELIVACNYLTNPKVLFLTTGTDGFSTFGKHRIPDAGTVSAAIEVIVNRKPLVLGKPNPRIMGKLLESGKIKPEKTLVIGNSLKTDIVFASLCGFQSLLVGDNKAFEEAQKIKKEGNEKKMKLVPDVSLPCLALLLELLYSDKPAKGEAKKTEQKKAVKK